jgi:hypothetical protein
MEIAKGLRLLAASLLIFTGIIHLAMAAIAADSPMAPGSALFGAIYLVLGIGLFMGRRIFYYLGAVVTVVGLMVGVYAYVAVSPEPVILPLAAVDIIIILCCLYLSLHKTK